MAVNLIRMETKWIGVLNVVQHYAKTNMALMKNALNAVHSLNGLMKRDEMMEDKLIKDRECIHCERLWECKGKPEGIQCVAFTPRKEKEGNKYGR